MTKFKYLLLLFSILIFANCEKLLVEPDVKNTPENVFEALWTVMNEKYALFESKGVDWNEFHDRYAPKIHPNMSNYELYEVLSTMLYELKDGHTAVWWTNGHNPYIPGRQHPKNFDINVIKYIYLLNNFKTKDGIIYGKCDNVGYMYVGDFTITIHNNTIGTILNDFANLDGLIIDVRDNGGGNLENVKQITQYFFEQKTLIGTDRYKNGPGRDDFVTRNLVVQPGSGPRYTKPCALLINENSFSATNAFVWHMKYANGIRSFGDKTSGGGGHPLYGELPNGWAYRLSSSISYTTTGYNTDLGFAPDEFVYMDETVLNNGKDLILETALDWIKSDGI